MKKGLLVLLSFLGGCTLLIGCGLMDFGMVDSADNQDVKTEIQYDFDDETRVPMVSVPVEIVYSDNIAPVIEGAHDLEYFLGDSIAYRSGVKVTDNVDSKVSLCIDNSNVNREVEGTYPVTYSATDSAGNTSSVTVMLKLVRRPEPEEVEVLAIADEIIAKLITPEMTPMEKAKTLFDYTKKNITYSYSAGDRSSLWAGVYEGMVDKVGDCFAFYAMYRVLLERVGIETMEVTRVNGNSNHWWVLVNLGDGWYHCDPSPRNIKLKYYCFMQTDAQIAAYEKKYTAMFPEHPNYYTFDETILPERETTVIYEN